MEVSADQRVKIAAQACHVAGQPSSRRDAEPLGRTFFASLNLPAPTHMHIAHTYVRHYRPVCSLLLDSPGRDWRIETEWRDRPAMNSQLPSWRLRERMELIFSPEGTQRVQYYQGRQQQRMM